MVIIPTYLYMLSNHKTLLRYYQYNKIGVLDIPIAIITIISINILSQYINSKILNIQGHTEFTNTAITSAYDKIINVIVLCIMPSIFEEILFRGVVLEEVTKNHSNFKACLITSLFFSLIHLDPVNILPQFIFSLFLCRIALTTKSILITTIAHLSNNLFVSIVQWKHLYQYINNEITMLIICILISSVGVMYFNSEYLRREI